MDADVMSPRTSSPRRSAAAATRAETTAGATVEPLRLPRRKSRPRQLIGSSLAASRPSFRGQIKPQRRGERGGRHRLTSGQLHFTSAEGQVAPRRGRFAPRPGPLSHSDIDTGGL